MTDVEESHLDRPEISEALTSLARVEERSLPVRYARMWLLEAQRADNSHDEVRHLAKAERQLGSAVLASATPSTELCRAFDLTMKARREATD
jgi:hypothetical protein